MFVVKQFAMVERAEGFVEMGGAIHSDSQKKFGKARTLNAAQAVETFANSFGDGGGHALTGKFGQLFGELLRFFILDVYGHKSTFLPQYIYHSTIEILDETAHRVLMGLESAVALIQKARTQARPDSRVCGTAW